MHIKSVEVRSRHGGMPGKFGEGYQLRYLPQQKTMVRNSPNTKCTNAWNKPLTTKEFHNALQTATNGSDVVQSGRPIFDDFFQHLWPYIGNNTANVVLQMVKRLWLIRIDQ
ncbi:hypothetical protein TNCV_2909501 [Trichonephila clavipes]|nr:hypothetical protein TNCV_2909501 [Trichonephila clavipes]